MYTWKDKDYKEKGMVKNLVNFFIKGLNSNQSPETFEIQIAQSDRLIDFSILITVEKKLELLGGDKSITKWKTLDLTHPGLETSRLFVDPKSETEIEIFHLPQQLNFSIFTYVHFKEPTVETNEKEDSLQKQGEEVGESFSKVLQFLKS